MPCCVAAGCPNRKKGRKPDATVSFHSFPFRNPALLKQWLQNLNRGDFHPTKSSRLCSEHFLPNCFKEDMYSKFGFDVEQSRRKRLGKILYPDAVPTLFEHAASKYLGLELEEKQQEMMEVDYSATELPQTHLIKSSFIQQVTSSPLKKRKAAETLSKPPPDLEETTDSVLDTSPPVPPSFEIETVPIQTQPEPVFPTWNPELSHKPTPLPTTKQSQSVSSPIIPLEPELSVEESPDFFIAYDPVLPSSFQQSEESDFPSPPPFVAPKVPLSRPPKQSPFKVLPVQYGTPRRTGKDHAYHDKGVESRGTQTPFELPTQTTEQTNVKEKDKSPPMITEPSSSPFQSSPVQPEEQGSDLAEYLPSSSSDQVTESSDSDQCIPESDTCKMEKYLVFEQNLAELLKFCSKCGSPVVEAKKFTKGTMVGYRIQCHEGHKYVWQSQPLQHRQAVGNLLIAAAIIISGNTYAKVSAFASLFNLLFLSKSLFNKLQKNNVLPVIQESWENERRRALEEVSSLGSVVLAGDGRCDSPGHTAKYGSYTLMHTDGNDQKGTRKIISMHLVQVSEVKNSNHMEPEGLKRCLNEVEDSGLQLGVLATDRHIMVSSMMKKEYPQIDHQFDTWHLAKSVVKKLTLKAKQKDCHDLSAWIQSISNHLWYSCATCDGDSQVLREKWLSVLHHITNKHEWCGNEKVHKCGHPPLNDTDRKEIRWLSAESPAFNALKKVVSDKGLLRDICHLTKFCHTGELEVFHSMLLKYCSKRQHFHYEAMYGRLMLAAIDWNHLTRQQATDQSGKPATAVVYSKRRKAFVLKNRYVKTKSQHMNEIVARVHEVHRDQVELRPFDRPADMPQNIARVEKPEKSDLERSFRSRFN